MICVSNVNNKYSTHLSFGKSKAPDEGGEFADFLVSKRFRKDVTTTDKAVAAALVTDFAKAAKTRGRFQLSFASKYCHHCVPNMFPIYDKESKRQNMLSKKQTHLEGVMSASHDDQNGYRVPFY